MRHDLTAWLERIGVEHPRGVLRGLDGVRTVAQRLAGTGLNIVPPAPTTIVVAGTNGKGSTTTFAEHLLLAAGRSVGTTTSPHVHAFNERIRVNGEEASDEAIVAAFEAVETCRGDVALSYFEYAILAAQVAIRRADVDCAVLEVGLGGRLDAVNATDADVAVITSIGLDHQEHLGTTREAIGTEKAGILRPGTPLVVGELNPPASVLARGDALAAPVYRAGRDFGHGSGALWIKDEQGRIEFEYDAGAIAPVNAATALQAVRLAGCPPDRKMVQQAARTARNPGRFEIVERHGRTWVLDVAHNAEGARFFASQVRQRFPGRRIAAIVGCLADKDIAAIVAPFKPLVDEIVYADTETVRGRSAASMRETVGDLAAFAGDLEAATAHLLGRDSGPRNCRGEDVILAFGSFDLVERMRLSLHLHHASAVGRGTRAPLASKETS